MPQIILWICGIGLSSALLLATLLSWYLLVRSKFKTEYIMPHREGDLPSKGSKWFLLQSFALLFAAGIVLMRTTQIVEGHADNVIENLIYAVSGMLFLRALGEFRVMGFFRTGKTGAFADIDRKYLTPAATILFIMSWPLL